jgi:hypothetical protein
MKNKDFSNKVLEQAKVERQLLPRLKFMGYVMYVLCLSSIAFEVFFPQETIEIEKNVELEAMTLLDEELNPKEVLNFYAVASVFALVGVACMLIARKKRKILFQPEVNNE